MSIEYYEAQYSRSKKAMQNKNKLLWQEWREDFDKRQKLKEEQWPVAWDFRVC